MKVYKNDIIGIEIDFNIGNEYPNECIYVIPCGASCEYGYISSELADYIVRKLESIKYEHWYDADELVWNMLNNLR